ncbi:MAG: hypothetical protein ACFFEN_02730 [Candidatus Thorarchaeota archaeon]
MRDPNELILKKIYTSFLTLSVSVIILSTIIAFFYNNTYPPCPTCAGCICEPIRIETLSTYIFMMILSTLFLIVALILYVIRRIIITRPSARIREEIDSRKYK